MTSTLKSKTHRTSSESHGGPSGNGSGGSSAPKLDLSNDNKITIVNESQHADDAISAKTKSRFPRLQECAHFHYEINTVELPKSFRVTMCNDDMDDTVTSKQQQAAAALSGEESGVIFHVHVQCNDKKWMLQRTLENFRYLDKHLHKCMYVRRFSLLEDLEALATLNLLNKENFRRVRQLFAQYLMRFNEIALTSVINCGPVLNWFEIDNKGNRLYVVDDSPINIPAVAAAVVKKRYVAQNYDEISLEVGNMISVIDMPPSDETTWWRGKKELEVGFFPCECVEIIRSNEHLSSNVTEHLPKISQSIRLKHGKLITLLRSFFNNRPARNHLQLKGIIKQRVFACDLGEHLSNTGKDVPEILQVCTRFIEKYGIVDGIYRHTGLQSNVQRLRNSFDEEKFGEIEQESYLNDVHSVSSLLKMYFRELPNPLLTYQLYDKFISIAESLMKSVNIENKIAEIHDVVQQLPPPHYRTLVVLMKHLHDLAKSSPLTSMNTKNLAIVWAPNLLKPKEMDLPGSMQYDMLYSITLQANIAEFLIANADTIFDDKYHAQNRKQDGAAPVHRPISVCQTIGTKLLSLEEAQDKYKQVGPTEMPKYHTVINLNSSG